jgi:hypothetical protein
VTIGDEKVAAIVVGEVKRLLACGVEVQEGRVSIDG